MRFARFGFSRKFPRILVLHCVLQTLFFLIKHVFWKVSVANSVPKCSHLFLCSLQGVWMFFVGLNFVFRCFLPCFLASFHLCFLASFVIPLLFSLPPSLLLRFLPGLFPYFAPCFYGSFLRSFLAPPSLPLCHLPSFIRLFRPAKVNWHIYTVSQWQNLPVQVMRIYIVGLGRGPGEVQVYILFLPSLFPCFLAFFLASFVVSLLSSLFPCFLPCVLASFFASLLISLLHLASLFPILLASWPPFLLSSLLPCFLTCFLAFFLAETPLLLWTSWDHPNC